MFSPGICWSGFVLNVRAVTPIPADELVGCETLEGLELADEVVGRDKVGEMAAELVVTLAIADQSPCPV